MKNQQRQSGQTLLEFALVLPILLLLVMGLFDLGRFILYYAVLNTAVREGTRFAIVQPFTDYGEENCDAATGINVQLCSEISSKFFSIGDLANSQITINRSGDPNAAVDPIIHITITHHYEPITPGLGFISNFDMKVESQMLISPKAIP